MITGIMWKRHIFFPTHLQANIFHMKYTLIMVILIVCLRHLYVHNLTYQARFVMLHVASSFFFFCLPGDIHDVLLYQVLYCRLMLASIANCQTCSNMSLHIIILRIYWFVLTITLQIDLWTLYSEDFCFLTNIQNDYYSP